MAVTTFATASAVTVAVRTSASVQIATSNKVDLSPDVEPIGKVIKCKVHFVIP